MLLKSNKIRYAFTVLMLFTVGGIATNGLLALHLHSCHSSHEQCNEKGSEKSSNHQTPSHDHSQCPICQILLGTAGKFLCKEAPTYLFITVVNRSVELDYSELFEQHTFSPATPRAPPPA